MTPPGERDLTLKLNVIILSLEYGTNVGGAIRMRFPLACVRTERADVAEILPHQNCNHRR